MSRVVDQSPYEAPADDTAMCEQYRTYVRKLLIRRGVHPDDAEDATQEVFAHLIRRDVRSMYEPEHTEEYSGKLVRCAFRSFLSAQVILYSRGIKEKNKRIAGREMCVLDAPSASGTSWAEMLAGSWVDDYGDLDDEELVGRMRAWLALQAPSGPAGPDLLALFDGLVEESHGTGALGLSAVKRASGLKSLRTALKGAKESPALPETSWDVHGVTLSVEDVCGAIAVLERAKGIMVAGPLERAGHPLAKAAKGWYHPFSEEERLAFPELEIDPATHKKPAGHVKLAVIHRLRRMLAETLSISPSPAQTEGLIDASGAARLLAEGATSGHTPAPEPEVPSPWEQIEATLWRLGAELADVDSCRELAEQGGMVLA